MSNKRQRKTSTGAGAGAGAEDEDEMLFLLTSYSMDCKGGGDPYTFVVNLKNPGVQTLLRRGLRLTSKYNLKDCMNVLHFIKKNQGSGGFMQHTAYVDTAWHQFMNIDFEAGKVYLPDDTVVEDVMESFLGSNFVVETPELLRLPHVFISCCEDPESEQEDIPSNEKSDKLFDEFFGIKKEEE